MLKQPPLIPTDLTPEDIVGWNNMELFKEFYAIAISPTNAGEFPNKRLDKEIGAENRPHIAETLQKLRDNGYFPDGFLPNGDIRWRVVLKGGVQQIVESEMHNYIGKSREELSRMAGSGQAVNDMPKLELWDMNHEKVLDTF